MGANKRLEIAKAPEAANVDAGENKMDQIRELMFGGAKPTGARASGSTMGNGHGC